MKRKSERKSKSKKLTPLAVLAAARELRAEPGRGVIVVDGARELVPLLARELRAGGEQGAVRERGRLDGAAALVWIGPPDEDTLRVAAKAHVPIVAVTESESVPYVLATDVVIVGPGQGLPIEEIAAALARRLGSRGPGLAAALPVLRRHVVDELIRSSARQNALLAAGLFAAEADMTALTMNQLRLVVRIARANGLEIDGSRALEVLGVVGAGFGFRAIGREALELFPKIDRAVKGAVALAGTKAIGEAARRCLAQRA